MASLTDSWEPKTTTPFTIMPRDSVPDAEVASVYMFLEHLVCTRDTVPGVRDASESKRDECLPLAISRPRGARKK